MANNATYSGRVKHKRDTAANWEKVKDTFQPFEGELIIVDTAAGATRFKVGRYDSSKSRLLYYGELPFTDEYLYSATNEKLGQISEIIDGKAAKSHTHTKTDVGLGNVDNTADADKSVKYATSAGSADSMVGVVDIAHGGTGKAIRGEALTALLAMGSGGSDLNLYQPGVCVVTTDTCTNCPYEPGYYMVATFRYHADDLACMQIANHLSSNHLYFRNYVGGGWKSWQMAHSFTGSDGIELGTYATAAHGGYIDFHFQGSTEDYTSRLIELASGTLSVVNNFAVGGTIVNSKLSWILLWSGKLQSGSATITNAAKYAAIMVTGHPGSSAYRTYICLPTDSTSAQMATNLVYMAFGASFSENDCTITITNNPSSGDIDFVYGLVQCKL